MKRRQKEGFLSQERKKRKGEKERVRRRKEEKKRNNGCSLCSFYSGYLEIVFDRKLLDGKGPFGDNVSKNPARYMFSLLILYIYIFFRLLIM